MTIKLLDIEGRAAAIPKTAARSRAVTESASQSTLREFPAKDTMSDLAMAEEILLKAAACINAPAASASAERVRNNRLTIL